MTDLSHRSTVPYGVRPPAAAPWQSTGGATYASIHAALQAGFSATEVQYMLDLPHETLVNYYRKLRAGNIER